MQAFQKGVQKDLGRKIKPQPYGSQFLELMEASFYVKEVVSCDTENSFPPCMCSFIGWCVHDYTHRYRYTENVWQQYVISHLYW